MTWKVEMVFTNEDSIFSGKFWDKGYCSKKIELISWHAVVAFSTGPTAAEGWWNRLRRETVADTWPARVRTRTTLKLVLNQEVHPAQYYIVLMSDFPMLETSIFVTGFQLLICQLNRAANIGADTVLKLGAQTPAQSAGFFFSMPPNLRCAPHNGGIPQWKKSILWK